MTTLLEFKHVSKQYGSETRALSDINFAVKEGEFVSIIGPSGAGKSTLLRCINRMIDASSGEIVFDNASVLELNKNELKKLRTRIGMIFQHYNLVNRLSVIENVLHGRLGYKSMLAGVLGIYSKEEKAQAYRLLQVLGLQEQVYKRCDQLSGGQKQRVGIARALVQDPKMLLCDEPIASLDPNSSKVIMEHLRDICSNMGITVVVNLHQVDVAINYSDRIIGVNKGTVVYDGSPAGLTKEKLRSIYGAEYDKLTEEEGGRHVG
jgi:phosphonate transport system ATP-binding protein